MLQRAVFVAIFQRGMTQAGIIHIFRIIREGIVGNTSTGRDWAQHGSHEVFERRIGVLRVELLKINALGQKLKGARAGFLHQRAITFQVAIRLRIRINAIEAHLGGGHARGGQFRFAVAIQHRQRANPVANPGDAPDLLRPFRQKQVDHVFSRHTHGLAQRHAQRRRVIIRHVAAHPIRSRAAQGRQFHASADHIALRRAFGAAISVSFKLGRVQHFHLQAVFARAVQPQQRFTIPRHSQHHQAAHINPGMPAGYIAITAAGPAREARFNAIIGVFIRARAAVILHLHLQSEALRAHHIAAQAFQEACGIAFILRQPA